MKVIGKILAVLFCILYTFILTGLITTAISLNLLSGDYYTSVIRSIDLSEIKVADFGNFFEDANLDEDASVEDALVKYFTESGVSEEVAIAVINNEKIREVIGKFIGDYMNYSVGGEKPAISREDVEAIFNEDDVKKLLEQSPEEIEVNIDKIYNNLNKLTAEFVENGGNSYDNTERNNNTLITNQ